MRTKIYTKTLKTLAIFCSIALVIAPLFACSKPSKNLTIGTDANHPPYEFMQHGELSGFDIELSKSIAEIITMKPHFIQVEFANLLNAVESGQVDMAIAAFVPTEAMSKKFDLIEYPSAIKRQSCLLRLKNVHLEEVPEVIIVAQAGTTREKDAMMLRSKNPSIVVKTAIDNETAIEAVKKGSATAAVIDVSTKKYISHADAFACDSLSAEDAVNNVIVLQKNSHLTTPLSAAIEHFSRTEQFRKMRIKWFL